MSESAFVPRRFVVAEFKTSDALLEGTRKMRDKGHNRVDTHTPYPVHGLEEALGIKKVRIPTLVLGAALTGVAAAYGMMYFMNAVDFPINVANRPPHSPLAFIPITFETMVLLGGTTAFFGLMTLLRLPEPYHPVFEWDSFARAAVDGFFLSVEVPAGEDPSDAANDARIVGAADVQVIVEPDAMRPALFLAWVLALGAVACNEDLLNPMSDRQAKVTNYGESDFYDDGMAMREPPAGTVPRERPVLNSAFSSGKVLDPGGTEMYVTTFPLKVDRPLVELGQKRFDIICAACHGPAGDGDSIVARQMALRPPSLHLYANRPVGYIYDVVTRGFGLMASYAAELPVRERWAVVSYVRALQMSQATPVDQAPADERVRLMQMPAEPGQTLVAPGAGPAGHQEGP